jgi:hypothetical protein
MNKYLKVAPYGVDWQALVHKVIKLWLHKGGEFLDYVNDCCVLSRDSAPRGWLCIVVALSTLSYYVSPKLIF